MTSDLLLCFSLWNHCCQCVFSQGWVKGGINPSCPSDCSHKQHNVISLHSLNAWKFRREKIFESSLKNHGFLFVRDGADHLNKTIKNCSCAVPVKVTLCKKNLLCCVPHFVSRFPVLLLFYPIFFATCMLNCPGAQPGYEPHLQVNFQSIGLTLD